MYKNTASKLRARTFPVGHVCAFKSTYDMQIDGGKGQLSAALRGLEEAGVTDLCVCSLAKREEEV